MKPKLRQIEGPCDQPLLDLLRGGTRRVLTRGRLSVNLKRQQSRQQTNCGILHGKAFLDIFDDAIGIGQSRLNYTNIIG